MIKYSKSLARAWHSVGSWEMTAIFMNDGLSHSCQCHSLLGGEPSSQESALKDFIWFHYTELSNLTLIVLYYILSFSTNAVAILDWFKWESLILQAVISSLKRYTAISFIWNKNGYQTVLNSSTFLGWAFLSFASCPDADGSERLR